MIIVDIPQECMTQLTHRVSSVVKSCHPCTTLNRLKLMSNQQREQSPTPQQVREARVAANLSQEDAARLVGLSSFTRWSEYERGKRNMEFSRFELFQIKTGQHREFGPLRRVRAAGAS